MRRSALLLASLLVTACGPVRYVPLEMVYPAPLPDSSVRVGSLQLRLRAGEEWLELSLRNAGADSVAMDWSEAVLVEPGGHVHSLVPVARIAALEDALRQQAVARWGPTGPPAAELEAAPAATSEAKRLLERLPQDPRVLVPPGAAVAEILYATQHLRVGADGRVGADRLLCSDRRGASRAGFELHLPLQRGGVREVITLVARTK